LVMTDRPWGIDPHNRPAFSDRLRPAGLLAGAWRGGAERSFTCWRQQARDMFLGLLPDVADTGVPAWTTKSERRTGDIIAERLEIGGPWCPIPALALRPAGPGPHPAVLLLHDHGSRFDIGKEKVIAPIDDAVRLGSAHEWMDRFYGGRSVGEELARRGFLVLAADALGWGERQGNGYDTQQALACNLMLYGVSLAGVIAREDMAAAAALRARPDVSGVAAVGFSFGGFRAWQVSALSDDVDAAVTANWMATLEGVMRAGNNQLRGQSAFTVTHPGAARLFDYPDMAGIAAPKPLLVHSGIQDALFPLDSVEEACGRLSALWSSAGAPQAFSSRFWPNGHVFGTAAQDETFAWLSRVLRPAQ
jgi:dienelactone hydrolase